MDTRQLPHSREGFARQTKRVIRGAVANLFGDAAAARLGLSYRRLSSALGIQPAARSQSNETELLDLLLRGLDVPRTFCEFGFEAAEFNCVALLRAGWQGLLIDGSDKQVAAANKAFAKLRATAVCAFLDVSNVRATVEVRMPRGRIGVLSVDVDGNDYWLLKELLPLEPALVVSEYNASFGLRPITVPYDPKFRRHEKHSSGLYHGASLTALTRLCAANGYGLVAVSESGLNGFFLRRDLIRGSLQSSPEAIYKQNFFRNKWLGTTADQQWKLISHLPYVEV